MYTQTTYSGDEADAAMCLWEHVLCSLYNEEYTIYDWMRGRERACAARDTCLALGPALEQSYAHAFAAGFDGCFDWDFVPRWADLVLFTGYHPEDIHFQVAKELGLAIARRYNTEYNKIKRDT